MTITAKIIADSVSPAGARLTTMQLRYPRFIHAEFMTHRVFSRNASSSRAIPVERLIQDVLNDPAMPVFWGRNQKGMQAREECNAGINMDTSGAAPDLISREDAWLGARNMAVRSAQRFHRAGYHKQIVNRLLEPFSHINVVVTATEWDNFFALRCHPDAQPEIRVLAEAMRDAMAGSTPTEDREHLPYIGSFLEDFRDMQRSTARCARVSYMTHDGKHPSVERDLELFDRLATSKPMHASPMEHPAVALDDPTEWCRNFRGWRQYRDILEETKQSREEN